MTHLWCHFRILFAAQLTVIPNDRKSTHCIVGIGFLNEHLRELLSVVWTKGFNVTKYAVGICSIELAYELVFLSCLKSGFASV